MKYIVLAAILAYASMPVLAQENRQSERASLRGIPSFHVDVTVEGPKHLAESDAVGTRSLIERVTRRLQPARLPVISRAEGPHLHIHLNMMEIEGGLVPFSIEASFNQEVRLEGSRMTMTAQTWDEGVLGLVSRDRLATIAEAVEGLADQFADDFRAVNR